MTLPPRCQTPSCRTRRCTCRWRFRSRHARRTRPRDSPRAEINRATPAHSRTRHPGAYAPTPPHQTRRRSGSGFSSASRRCGPWAKRMGRSRPMTIELKLRTDSPHEHGVRRHCLRSPARRRRILVGERRILHGERASRRLLTCSRACFPSRTDAEDDPRARLLLSTSRRSTRGIWRRGPDP